MTNVLERRVKQVGSPHNPSHDNPSPLQKFHNDDHMRYNFIHITFADMMSFHFSAWIKHA